MKKIIIAFFIGTLFAGSLFQFDIGLPNYSKNKVKKVSSQVTNQKTKLKKGIAKRAASRAATTAAKTAITIPFVTTGVAATTAVVITAHEYCETMQILENISYTLEGKEHEEWSLESCSKDVYEEMKTFAKESKVSFGDKVSDTWDNTVTSIADTWNSMTGDEKKSE